ncbi:MAG: transposase [Hymenobacter sp.]|nr:MAG: transposase [Hymenobacter sp.]
MRPLVAPFYSPIGRPSLDPVFFVKLLLVQHLENITSDRKLLELGNLHVGIRAFLGYELAQPLPWHSIISRLRQRLPVAVFEACFTYVIGLCVQQGLALIATGVEATYYRGTLSGESGPLEPCCPVLVPYAELRPLVRPGTPLARRLRARGLW